MKTPHFIARRYLIARRGKSVINIISWISLIGIAVGTAALIIVLSVYNGIGQVTQSLYNVFDPELSVQPAQGKSFTASDELLDLIQTTPGVARLCPIVEENAWVTHQHNEAIVQLRGVGDNYAQLSGLDTLLDEGTYLLRDHRAHYLLLGGEIAYNLGVGTYTNTPLALHIPRRGTSIGLTMEEAFHIAYAYPAGTFSLQQDIDGRYIIAHIDLLRQLLDYSPQEVTSLALQLENPRHLARVKRQLAERLGPQYRILDRTDQQPLYYKVFRSERVGVILVLSLIVLIASLNLIASLSLLIIDKRRDIALLRSLGMTPDDIQRTFRATGRLTSLIGIGVGLLVGFLICLVQQRFGLVRMGDNYIVEAFPVAMRWQDFLLTLLTTLVITFLSTTLTTRRLK